MTPQYYADISLPTVQGQRVTIWTNLPELYREVFHETCVVELIIHDQIPRDQLVFSAQLLSLDYYDTFKTIIQDCVNVENMLTSVAGLA